MPESLSLRSRLLRQLLAPLALVFVSSGALCYYAAIHYAAQEYNRTLYDMAHSLARLVRVTPQGATLDLPAAAEQLFLWDDVDVTYYRVWGERSGQVAGYPDLEPATNAEDFHGVAIGPSVVHGEEIRVATLKLPATAGGETVFVRVGETQRKRARFADTVVLRILLPQLLLLALVMVFVGRGIRRGLEPLDALAARIESRAPDDRSPISEPEAPREVAALIRALDAMFQRLDAATAAQRDFVADTAHQLRTPLAAIRLNLERAQAQEASKEVRDALAAVRVSVERAVRLSNQLLELARLEDGAGQASLAVFDLRELVRETGAEWIAAALHHGVDLAYEPADTPVWVRGDRHSLKELLSNLIDNALKHGGGAGGSIVLSVSRSTDRAVLRVSDDGPGIDPRHREQAMRRYARGDRGGQGAGLGLAIAAEAARRHGGELRLADGLSGRGLSVVVELPLSDAA
ncbi:MAG: sensor histidine kinase [Nevskiaceae bacterium]|nr:MAG: sensor histidine kinase [Nevskiaceae bacterium]